MADHATHIVAAGAIAGAALLLASCSAAAPSSAPPASLSAGSNAPSPSSSRVDATAATIDPGDGGIYQPRIDPATFTPRITNPYLPLTPGSRWVYRETGNQKITVTVTRRTRRIMGIDAVVVRDVAQVHGQVSEDTRDWYAQDDAGNVWYLGEATAEFDHGRPVSTAGSWQAGVAGAQPGIVMPAQPRVGAAYRQEYLAGEAEDMAAVLSTTGTAVVLGKPASDVVVTKEWSPLEPKVVEVKAYVRGIGQVSTRTVAGGHESQRLLSYHRGG